MLPVLRRSLPMIEPAARRLSGVVGAVAAVAGI